MRLTKSKKAKEKFTRTVSILLVAMGAFVIMIPAFWMLVTSVKQKDNTQTMPPEWLPRESAKVVVDGKNYFLYDVNLDGEIKRLAAIRLNPEKSEFRDPEDFTQVYYAPAQQARKVRIVKFHWENYRVIWKESLTPFSTFMKNTLMYSTLAVVGEVLSCAIIGYGFARLRAPGKNVLFYLVLATMMLPWAVTMIPNYVLFTNHIPNFINKIFNTRISLSDSWLPLILPKFFGSPYLIFLVRQFIMSIPKDYDEAAVLDGASYFKIWAHIIMPMSIPVLISIAILSFMYHWNDYMGPMIYLNTNSRQPISVGLANYQLMYGGTPYNLLMAGSVLSIIPLIIIFFFLNRYFTQGIVISGVKG